MSVQVSQRGMLRLIQIDTLRRLHNVGFLVERLIYTPSELLQLELCKLIIYNGTCNIGEAS